VKTWLQGLSDADGLATVLDRVDDGLLLHGHLHRRIQRALPTRAGKVLAVGATSASLEHDSEHRMAGFNLYAFDGAGGLESVEAHVFDPEKKTFRVESIPKLV
jgi:hypothetical protein